MQEYNQPQLFGEIMKQPHKFTQFTNGSTRFDIVIICEYCGVLAFHGNTNLADNEPLQAKAAQGCPCAPEINSDVLPAADNKLSVAIFNRNCNSNIPNGYELHYEEVGHLNMTNYILRQGQKAVFDAPSHDIALAWLSDEGYYQTCPDDQRFIACEFINPITNIYTLVPSHKE